MDWIKTANELTPYLLQGNIDYCIQHVIEIIRQLPVSPFHHVLDVDFTNDPAEVAAHFEKFAHEQNQLCAIYTETNGFFLNYDLWYFEIFGYSICGGHDDYDWLSYFDSSYAQEITLTGMESLQQIYQQVLELYDTLPDSQVDHLQIPNSYCDLLVVLRFQNLIRRSAVFMQKIKVPIFATSHEYDFIYSVNPREVQNK